MKRNLIVSAIAVVVLVVVIFAQGYDNEVEVIDNSVFVIDCDDNIQVFYEAPGRLSKEIEASFCPK